MIIIIFLIFLALTSEVNTGQNYDINLNNDNVNMNVAHMNLNQSGIYYLKTH